MRVNRIVLGAIKIILEMSILAGTSIGGTIAHGVITHGGTVAHGATNHLGMIALGVTTHGGALSNSEDDLSTG